MGHTRNNMHRRTVQRSDRIDEREVSRDVEQNFGWCPRCWPHQLGFQRQRQEVIVNLSKRQRNGRILKRITGLRGQSLPQLNDANDINPGLSD
jgi:hypothetical protein